MESAILLEELETLDSNILLEEVASAKEEAERPGLDSPCSLTDLSVGHWKPLDTQDLPLFY